MGDGSEADEGLFLATLQDTGTVWLQSLPFSRMSDRIPLAANKWAAMTRARVQCWAVLEGCWMATTASAHYCLGSGWGQQLVWIENLIRIKHLL